MVASCWNKPATGTHIGNLRVTRQASVSNLFLLLFRNFNFGAYGTQMPSGDSRITCTKSPIAAAGAYGARRISASASANTRSRLLA